MTLWRWFINCIFTSKPPQEPGTNCKYCGAYLFETLRCKDLKDLWWIVFPIP